MFEKAKSLIISIIVLLIIAILAHPLAANAENVSLLDPETPVRFLGALIVGVLALVAYYFSNEHPAWEMDARTSVYAVVGAVVSGVVRWLFNGQTFPLPALEQVTLQPALLPPILFGVAFGPVVGFIAGAGGSLLANLFVGWVLPQVDFAYGLVGLVAGLTVIWTDEARVYKVLLALAGVLALAATGLYFAYPTQPVVAPPYSEPQPPTLLLGLSALLGAALAIATRYAFPNRPRWGWISLWGVVAVFAGLLYRALALMFTENLSSPQEALVGEILGVVGAHVLAVAIFVPILLAVYEWYDALPDAEEETG